MRCDSLHPIVRAFAEAAKAKGYVIELGRMQLMVSYGGQKLGGWNTNNEHWYVSKVIAQGRSELLESHGFLWKEKPGHQWWQIDGVGRVSEFRAVVAQLTGVPIP